MSNIQFIFEKPQRPAQTVKKRTRLITSCDACRLKKIKCRPTGHGDDKCEACEASGSVCVFNERNRIRSQRGIANFTVAPTRHTRKVSKRTTSPDRLRVSILAPTVNGGPSMPSSSTSTPPAPRGKSSPNYHSSNSSKHVNNPDNESSSCHSDGRCPSPGSSGDYLLFDPIRHAYPHPRLLPHFLELFLLYAGSLFPFFEPEETTRLARDGTLSPLIANCVAAFAARFSDELHHPPGARHLSGEPYLDVAKYFLSETTSNKLEQLHAIILIAWIENGSGRTTSFYSYSQMATSLAVELQLCSEEYICQDPSEDNKSRCRTTFWSVIWLDIIACSVTGRNCTWRLDECSTSMPYPDVKECGTLSRSMLYQAFRGILNVMISLNVCSNAGRPSAPSARRDIGLRQIQSVITTFKERLPQSLAFTAENLSLSTLYRESFAFYLVHALMHCFLIITNCPSLFWASQPPKTITEVPRLDIAWSSATAIIDILILMRNENMTFTTGIPSTFLPLSIARGALLLAQTDPGSAMGDMSVEEFELTTRYYLEETAEMLKSLSRYWASLRHVEISTEVVALCGIQTLSLSSKSLPACFKQLTLNDTWSHPSSGETSFDYLNGPSESGERLALTGENWYALPESDKDIAPVDRYALVRRYGPWQGNGQTTASV